LKRWFQETCLGLELQDDPFLPQRNRLMFGLFTIASVIYRWVVVFSIVWFVMKVLEPYGLQALGRLLAVAGFSGLVAQPIIQTWKFVRTPGRLSKVKRVRALTSFGIVAAILTAVGYIPLPHHIDCAFEIRPSEAGSVYAATAGRLEWARQPGEYVESGDAVAQLANPDLMFRLAELEGQEELARVQLASLTRRSGDDESAKLQKSYQLGVLDSIQKLKAKTEIERDRLTVRAKRDGYILPPPERQPQDSGDGRLPGWTGTPLDAKNIGALMTPEDRICEIGTPKAYEAVLIIDQGDIQLVRVGQEVDLKLDSKRLVTFSGELTEMATNPMQAASTNLSSQTGGDLQTEIDPSTGQIKPRSVSFQARVPIDFDGTPLRPGYRGSAKIHVDPMSLGRRLWRLIAKTFNFEF